MQVRISRVTRGGKTYEYPQLVESFRRPSDGTPMHRVIANLSGLSTTQVTNLKTALAANREGKRVAIARPPVRAVTPVPRILANFSYLDVALLHEIWKEWRLPQMLEELMPAGSEEDVAPASVVAALAIQRGVAPGSKLFATEWFPRSALPELLRVVPTSFNNTRVHRVLDELDRVAPALMDKLPVRYQEGKGAFASLFLDVTDTWFFGGGPSFARAGKTKEGFVQRKIGIVLLCNEDGYPVRWDVVQGTTHDSRTMTAMVKAISKLDWVGETPLVCDRAMGKTAQIRMLATSGLRFLTALTVAEFNSYTELITNTETIPNTERLPNLGAMTTAEETLPVVSRAGMKKAEDNLYVMDLGTVERTEDTSGAEPSVEASVQEALRHARKIKEGVQTGEHKSYASAGRVLGISRALASKYCRLSTLEEGIQSDVLEGKADGRTLVELLTIARLPANEQRAAFHALTGVSVSRLSPVAEGVEKPKAVPFTVRVLAYFNPDRFAEQRERARKRLEEVDNFVAELNTSLAGPRSRLTRDGIAAAVDRFLRGFDLVGAYALGIDEEKVVDRVRFRVRLELNKNEWARRRRYDGFTVLVAHPSLTEGAAELCRLYRAKDAVEKDFQAIKGLIKLRPVHHRTDAKVRAHVTLCMLALLLERTLQKRLKGAYSAEAALELLAPCHLNRLMVLSQPVYSLTEPTPEQRSILRALGHERLVDDGAIQRLAAR